jgi:hypothetical protein
MNVSDTTKTKINLQIMIMEQMQKYRKSMTGAAASIMEAEEYKEMFP